jgi:wobble nucleotide-excising tRNase
MLQKIQQVKEIGRFSDLAHKAPQFSKLSLVYARNGLGKSTVCSVLRSATEADPNLILARKRAGSTNDSEVELLLDGIGVIAFAGGAWKKAPGSIIVFDQEYIHRNLHVGDSVTRDNKRSLVPVVLGQAGVKLAEAVNALDIEQRDLVDEIKQISRLISAQVKAVDTHSVQKYCEASIPPDIDAQVEQARKEAELGRKAAEVARRRGLTPIETPGLDGLIALLSETIAEISDDAVSRVREHLKKHGMSVADTRWLNAGFNLNRLESACPYCDQPIDGLEIIQSYKGYFSEAFAALHSRCRKAVEKVEALAEKTDWPEKIAALRSDVEFWKSVASLPVQPSITDADREVIEVGLREILGLLRQKLENPVEPWTVSGDALDKINAAFSALSKVDQDIASCSDAIAEAKRSAGSVNSVAAEQNLAWLEAIRDRQTDAVSKLVERYNQAASKKTEVEESKAKAQTDLRVHTKKEIGPRQNEINRILETFGANFKIVDTQTNFKGREANAEYALEVGGEKFPAGEKKVSEPSFSTILSAGDKGTLALAFFLAQVLADPDLSDAIVVFDDPFSSQDLARQFETESQIRALVPKAKQVIVFSHDPRFLNNIQKDAPSDVTSTFQLLCQLDGVGTVSRWNAAEELKQPYIRNSEIVREFAAQGVPIKGQSIKGTAQAIRPFLEDYMRARMPGRFGDTALISAMLPEIETAGASDPLFTAIADLSALNEYSRRYMHAGSPDPDQGELKAQCQKVIRIVGEY